MRHPIDTSSEAKLLLRLGQLGENRRPQENTDFELQPERQPPNSNTQTVPKHKSSGFKDIAGMEEQKRLIREGLINLIQNQQLAKEYNLSPPSVLLYGPPGCGKTFFAEKTAEEAGVSFIKINPDDIASHYVHGVQEKIGELFIRAGKMAPTIVFLDEFDAMVPKRTSNDNGLQNGEVNEFLCMMNNASERGIYIMAATNHPEYIDPSILRTGRIDEKIFIGMPDKESREALFRLTLSKLPIQQDIDYYKLADSTEGFNCSDIKYVVNVASRTMFNKCITYTSNGIAPITQELLEDVIAHQAPSVSKSELREYERIHSEFSPKDKGISRRTIGFH